MRNDDFAKHALTASSWSRPGWLRQPVTLAAALCLLVACSGGVGSGDGDDGDGDGDGDGDTGNGGSSSGGRGGNGSPNLGGAPPPPPVSDECKDRAKRILEKDGVARLTAAQYRNTVRDLFAGHTVPQIDFPEERAVHGFLNNTKVQATAESLVEGYATASEKLAKVVADNLSDFAPCSGDEVACGKAFIAKFGAKAFRRPLADDVRTSFETFFTQMRTEHGYATAIRLVTEAFLNAPAFLYRLEPGSADESDPALAKLDDYEVASRLSYMLTDTMPDDELFSLAEEGKLGDRNALLAQADRLMTSDKGREAIARFHDQWLHTNAIDYVRRDSRIYPDWKLADNDAYKASYRKFIEHAFWEEGTVEALLTSKTTFADARLGAIQGVDVNGNDLQKVDLASKGDASSQRAGLLTQPAWLAFNAHDTIDAPVLRGLFIFERFLCFEPPAVPDEVPPLEFDAVNRKQTARMMLEEQHEQGSCKTCHKPFDTLGFAFGHYDAVGAWRTEDAGLPVNAKVELPALGDKSVEGALELASELAKSSEVRRCVATQWFRYGFGRTEQSSDSCIIEELDSGMSESGGDMRALVKTIVGSEAFRFRRTLQQ
ncbi:MAG: DUF1592 domain-containing protein [Myxococcales bacterium]|nr:DUF1592 domain-containing protein [Myxococcales bacterium]